MNTIITSTALKYSPPNRKNILKLWIDHLRNVRSINNWVLFVGIEEGCEEDMQIYDTIDFMDVVYVKNYLGRGAHANHVSVWTSAYQEGSEFMVFLEDDVLAGPDLCEYFSELGPQYKENQKIFCINSYTGNENIKNKFSVWQKPSLGVWGFGMWRDRTKECLTDYYNTGIDKVKQIGWDVHLNTISRRERTCIMPCFSRTLNIGMDGIHSRVYDPELDINKRVWTGNEPPDTPQNLPFTKLKSYSKHDYVMSYKNG